MIQPGTLLQNRYRVAEQIGKGGMGEVYLATDERFQSTVAVKRTFYDDPEMCRAFAREARLLNRLRHTALPKVSDHFSEGGEQFLVMEFIDGTDLSELLKQRKVPFPLADVLRWADQLLDALEYLHTQQPPVIHRDIKPQNIKLTPRGSVVLLDFGLAKGLPAQTASGPASSVFGYSLNFAPLEQMQGAGTDARSDLYSLAATLYFLLTGVRPPDALTRAAAVVKQQPDPLRPAHLIQAQVPEAVGQILHRAMSQNAPLRHASAPDLRAALRQATSDAAPRDAFPQKADPPAHKKSDADIPSQSLPTPPALTLLGLPAQPRGPGARAPQPGEQSPSPPEPPQPASRESEAGLTPDSLRRQRTSDSRTISARVAPRRGGPASHTTPGLVACLLVACAASGAYLFTRTPAPRPPAAAISNTAQAAPTTFQQADPAGQPKSPAGNSASDAPNAAPDLDASAKSVPARPAGDTSSPDAQTSADAAASHTTPQPNTNTSTTNPDGLNGAAASAGRPTLVIQNPAPAEDDRRAGESRREQSDESRREQPASRPDYTDRPPPGPAYPPPGYPPPPDARRPPPPDGRRPPPQFRPPLP